MKTFCSIADLHTLAHNFFAQYRVILQNTIKRLRRYNTLIHTELTQESATLRKALAGFKSHRVHQPF
jgi:hypothetical protein